MAEEDAIESIGSVSCVADQIVDEITASRIIEKEQKSSRRLGSGAITLLILGFPLWFSLLLAGFIVVLSFYIVLWTFTICMWVVEAYLSVLFQTR